MIIEYAKIGKVREQAQPDDSIRHVTVLPTRIPYIHYIIKSLYLILHKQKCITAPHKDLYGAVQFLSCLCFGIILRLRSEHLRINPAGLFDQLIMRPVFLNRILGEYRDLIAELTA